MLSSIFEKGINPMAIKYATPQETRKTFLLPFLQQTGRQDKNRSSTATDQLGGLSTLCESENKYVNSRLNIKILENRTINDFQAPNSNGGVKNDNRCFQ